MLNWKETRIGLLNYRNYVITQSKRNLTRIKMRNSSLYKSLRGIVMNQRNLLGQFSSGMPQLTFYMNDYGKFVDEGVHGSKSSYIANRDSKNKFKGGKKSVPLGPIRKWCKQKGISTKLAFVIGRSIYEKGIKASQFFTKPLEKRDKSFKAQYHQAIADDIATNFANKIQKKLLENKNIKRKI